MDGGSDSIRCFFNLGSLKIYIPESSSRNLMKFVHQPKKTELWGLKFDTRLEGLGNDKFTVITQVYKENPFPKAK